METIEMTETRHSTSEVISLIQRDPLDVALWERVAKCISAQRDTLSAKSLEVIIRGLRELKNKIEAAQEKGESEPFIATGFTALFGKLASNYNNPKLLKEIGKIYLNDWLLPEIALEHFERAQRLGGPEKELRPLIEAAAVSAQRQTLGLRPPYSGLRNPDQAHPIVPEVIRKSGLLLPRTIRSAPATRVPESKIEAIPGEAPLPEETGECLRQVTQALEAKDFARAEALLLRAGDNPAHAQELRQGWANLGMAHYEAGNPAEMERAYEKALQFDPANFSSCFNLGLARQLLQKYDEAETFYLAANRLSPDHPKVWCNLGALYFQMGRHREAEAALRRSVALKPDYARAWDNLGSTLGAQNKLDEALAACRQAIELRPGYPDAYFKMSLIFFSKNLLHEASAALGHAFIAPQLAASAHALKATIHARLEDTKGAALSIARAAKADPQCELLWMAWNELGHAHFTLEDYESAASAYNEAVQITPHEPEPWFHLGLAFHALEQIPRAEECYRQAIHLNNDHYAAWHNLGLLYADRGARQETTECFRNEVRIKTSSARAWHDLAASLEIEGKKEEAREAYAKAEALLQLGYA